MIATTSVLRRLHRFAVRLTDSGGFLRSFDVIASLSKLPRLTGSECAQLLQWLPAVLQHGAVSVSAIKPAVIGEYQRTVATVIRLRQLWRIGDPRQHDEFKRTCAAFLKCFCQLCASVKKNPVYAKPHEVWHLVEDYRANGNAIGTSASVWLHAPSLSCTSAAT